MYRRTLALDVLQSYDWKVVACGFGRWKNNFLLRHPARSFHIRVGPRGAITRTDCRRLPGRLQSDQVGIVPALHAIRSFDLGLMPRGGTHE